jgi:hypothetical protein
VHAGKIETLVRIDRTAVHDTRFDTRRGDVHGEQLDQTVIDQDSVTHVNVVCEVIVSDRYLAFLLETLVNENEIVAGIDVDGSIDVADPYARTLEITEERDGTSKLIRETADERDRLAMLRVSAMREIEAGDVHSRLDQSFYRLCVRA